MMLCVFVYAHLTPFKWWFVYLLLILIHFFLLDSVMGCIWLITCLMNPQPQFTFAHVCREEEEELLEEEEKPIFSKNTT